MTSKVVSRTSSQSLRMDRRRSLERLDGNRLWLADHGERYPVNAFVLLANAPRIVDDVVSFPDYLLGSSDQALDLFAPLGGLHSGFDDVFQYGKSANGGPRGEIKNLAQVEVHSEYGTQKLGKE